MFGSSSIHGLPSDMFSVEAKDGVYHPFFSREYCFFDQAAPPAGKADSGSCDHHQKLSDSVISPSRKRVAAGPKKDRHTKIFTAQGPRDRRVRLSIDISRKFFGLQDLLGFDKASKTLDWLFTNSKTAIKDLVEQKKHITSFSTLSNQCEQVFMEETDYLHKNIGRNKKSCVNGAKIRKKKTTRKQKSGFHVNLAARRQLRAEARSRARARTMQKLLINNDVKNVLGDRRYSYLQSSCENQFQSQSKHEVKIGESLTQEKLSKPYYLLYNSQHNCVDSKDSSSSQFKNSTC